MVKISVIITSFRYGGIDVMFGGLKNQTLKDYELIFVDEIYEERHAEVKEYAELLNIPLIHLPAKPHRNPNNPIHLCESWNKGLIHASGKLVMFNNDFVYLAEDCLERHYKIQEANNFKLILGGIMDHYDHPPLGDLKGKLTVFDKLHEEKPEKLIKLDDRFPHHVGLVFSTTTNMFPNCTLPLDLALEVEGFNERFDAGHGYQDDEFLLRCFLKSKYPLVVDTFNENYHVDHSFDLMKVIYTPITINLYKEMVERMRRGEDITCANNGYLKEERRKIGKPVE
jgi:glycosyltransferase involved in cell wall biosynthesis